MQVRDFVKEENKEENEALKRQNARLQLENEKLKNALGNLLGYAVGALWGGWRHYVASVCKRALNYN